MFSVYRDSCICSFGEIAMSTKLGSNTLSNNNFDRLHPGLVRVNMIINQIYDHIERTFGRSRPTNSKLEAEYRFVCLSENKQLEIIRTLEGTLSFLDHAVAQEIPLKEDVRLLELAAKKLNLGLSGDLFDTLTADDLFEIFDSEGIQIYRSFSFFNYSNYSLLELSTYSWYELYERPSSIEKKLYSMFIEAIQGDQIDWPLSEIIAPYTIRELHTDDPATFLLTEKSAHRLRKWPSGEPYVLSIKKCKDISHATSLDAGKILHL